MGTPDTRKGLRVGRSGHQTPRVLHTLFITQQEDTVGIKVGKATLTIFPFQGFVLLIVDIEKFNFKKKYNYFIHNIRNKNKNFSMEGENQEDVTTKWRKIGGTFSIHFVTQLSSEFITQR